MPDMRFAPPNPIRIADRSSGLNAVSVRSYNERLVLSLLLQHGGMSRLEIGTRTGLSAQAVSVIVRSLEQDRLLTKGKAQKGRVGPPTIPMSLNPKGAFSIGISIGFRKTDLVLIDFAGDVVAQTSLQHDEPGLHFVHPEISEKAVSLVEQLDRASRDRIAGIGLALPDDFAASDALDQMRSDLERLLDLEVFVQNDVTAAASGESIFGAARELDNYLFFYVGANVHSRLVLNHQIYKNGNTAGSNVGLLAFERHLGANGAYSGEIWERTNALETNPDALRLWRQDLQAFLSDRVAELSNFVEVKTIVVSSYLPSRLCSEICNAISETHPRIEAVPGSLTSAPKAVGAASLPYSSHFGV